MSETSDPHYDLNASVDIVMDCIQTFVKAPGLRPEELHAARYLAEKIMNYRVLLRKRPVNGTYEFLNPPAGNPGWYYKTDEGNIRQEAFNWRGPYSSRKAAIAAHRDRPELPRNRLRFIEQRLGLGAPKGTPKGVTKKELTHVS